MFELFKKRDFSDYITDTIDFFKLFGKNYFRHYFVINGGPLLILMVLLYFIVKIYTEFFMPEMSGSRFNKDAFSIYFTANTALIVIAFFFFLAIAIIISLINVTFPIVYLNLYEKKGTTEFSVGEIVTELKSHVALMIKFTIGLLFIIAPLLTIILIINILLCIIIVGIPLLFIVIPALMTWIILSYYDYIVNQNRFFRSLSVGLSMLKQQFWTIVGTTLLVVFIIQFIQGIVSFIPSFFGIVSLFTISSGSATAAEVAGNGAYIAIIMLVSTTLGYVMNNFFFINQGLIFYSQREATESNSTHSLIDSIGKDSE